MEPYAIKVLVGRLLDEKLTIRVLATDRSGPVKTLMKKVNGELEAKNRPTILHCFDTWHFTKSIGKDMWKFAKLQKCIALSCWIKSVKNQVWFGIAYCGGNVEMLKEIILSIPQHCAGIHEFPENRFFKRCAHGPLSSERDKPFLKVGSAPYKKLVEALRGKRNCRFKDLEQLTEIHQTSVNEQLNNVHNSYLSKSTFFRPTQARVRGCLAVIDHNKNVNRPAKKDVDGDDQYDRVQNRDGTHYTAKKVKVEKDNSWRAEIVAEVVEAVRAGVEPQVKVPTYEKLKVFGRKLEKPDKATVVAATKARRRFKNPVDQ